MTYQVIGELLRSKGAETNKIVIDELFYDENPLKARDKAFLYCQNYIDVFMESIGKNYVNFENAQKLLKDFYSSGEKNYFLNDRALEIEVNSFNNLCIYLIPDVKKFTKTQEGTKIYEDIKLIHYFGHDFEGVKDYVIKGLRDELKHFRTINFPVDNKIQMIEIIKEGKVVETFSVLDSPINFAIYNS